MDDDEDDCEDDGNGDWDNDQHSGGHAVPYVYVDRVHEMNDDDANGQKRKNTGGVSCGRPSARQEHAETASRTDTHREAPSLLRPKLMLDLTKRTGTVL